MRTGPFAARGGFLVSSEGDIDVRTMGFLKGYSCLQGTPWNCCMLEPLPGQGCFKNVSRLAACEQDIGYGIVVVGRV